MRNIGEVSLAIVAEKGATSGALLRDRAVFPGPGRAVDKEQVGIPVAVVVEDHDRAAQGRWRLAGGRGAREAPESQSGFGGDVGETRQRSNAGRNHRRQPPGEEHPRDDRGDDQRQQQRKQRRHQALARRQFRAAPGGRSGQLLEFRGLRRHCMSRSSGID